MPSVLVQGILIDGETTLLNGKDGRPPFVSRPDSQRAVYGPHEHEVPFYAKQKRLVLANSSQDGPPERIEDYIFFGGYIALAKALLSYKTRQYHRGDEELPACRGRGGGGFPTGRKWESTLKKKRLMKMLLSVTVMKVTQVLLWTEA